MNRIRSFFQSLLGQRPNALQVAALCRRPGRAGPEVLLVTSLDTGRLIVPKGWPMRGRSLADAALREAWEEAGVRGQVRPDALGRFFYTKRRKSGLVLRCEVRCFLVDVTGQDDTFPEMGRRERLWLAPKEAARKVREKDLKALLRSLDH